MSYIEKIEILNERLETANHLGAVYSGISWSFAASLCNTLIALHSPDVGFLTSQRLAERTLNLEIRADRLSLILAWAASMSLKDYRPSGEEVVERFNLSKEFVPDEELAQAKADATGLTLEEIQDLLEIDALQMAERNALQRSVLAKKGSAIKHTIDAAIAAPVDAALELNSREAAQLLRKMLGKVEDSIDKVGLRILRARRMSEMRKFLADRRLLQGLQPEVEALLEAVEAELEGASERSPVEQVAVDLTERHQPKPSTANLTELKTPMQQAKKPRKPRKPRAAKKPSALNGARGTETKAQDTTH